jgi:hypothetical protein
VIGIVIVAHGGLAKEYLAAVEHVVGRQIGIRTVSIDLVNGFQSTLGLSMTTAGIVCVTMRSITWMISRCLACPFALSA